MAQAEVWSMRGRTDWLVVVGWDEFMFGNVCDCGASILHPRKDISQNLFKVQGGNRVLS